MNISLNSPQFEFEIFVQNATTKNVLFENKNLKTFDNSKIVEYNVNDPKLTMTELRGDTMTDYGGFTNTEYREFTMTKYRGFTMTEFEDLQ